MVKERFFRFGGIFLKILGGKEFREFLEIFNIFKLNKFLKKFKYLLLSVFYRIFKWLFLNFRIRRELFFMVLLVEVEMLLLFIMSLFRSRNFLVKFSM